MTSAADIVMSTMFSGRRATHRIGVLGLATALPVLLILMSSILLTNASI